MRPTAAPVRTGLHQGEVAMRAVIIFDSPSFSEFFRICYTIYLFLQFFKCSENIFAKKFKKIFAIGTISIILIKGN